MASSLQRKEKEGKKTYIHVAKLLDQQQETQKNKKKHNRTTKHNAKQHSYFHRQAQFTICI